MNQFDQEAVMKAIGSNAEALAYVVEHVASRAVWFFPTDEQLIFLKVTYGIDLLRT